MNTFESRCDQLETMAKNWKTDSLFLSEAAKLADERTSDASTRCDAEITDRIKTLKALITAQETWLWTQRESLLDAQEVAQESPCVQWLM